jgi:hypothetical protein
MLKVNHFLEVLIKVNIIIYKFCLNLQPKNIKKKINKNTKEILMKISTQIKINIEISIVIIMVTITMDNNNKIKINLLIVEKIIKIEI